MQMHRCQQVLEVYNVRSANFGGKSIEELMLCHQFWCNFLSICKLDLFIFPIIHFIFVVINNVNLNDIYSLMFTLWGFVCLYVFWKLESIRGVYVCYHLLQTHVWRVLRIQNLKEKMGLFYLFLVLIYKFSYCFIRMQYQNLLLYWVRLYFQSKGNNM
jgi:hypothetical protein